MKSFSRVRHLVTPWTATYQTPPSMGFSRLQHLSVILYPEPFLHPEPRPTIHPPSGLSPIMTVPRHTLSSGSLPSLSCLCPALSGLSRTPHPGAMPPYHLCRQMCMLLENEVGFLGVGHLRFSEVFGVAEFQGSGQGLSRCFLIHSQWSVAKKQEGAC